MGAFKNLLQNPGAPTSTHHRQAPAEPDKIVGNIATAGSAPGPADPEPSNNNYYQRRQ